MKKSDSFTRKGNTSFPFSAEKEQEICPFCGQEVKKVRVGIGFGAAEEKICECKSKNFATSSRGWGSK
ncbi:MAG: hypothetical protein U9R14_03330 [Patescibacteria group bacterium]|nr:hypothetical protein [Patescibacteria group bacterium]